MSVVNHFVSFKGVFAPGERVKLSVYQQGQSFDAPSQFSEVFDTNTQHVFSLQNPVDRLQVIVFLIPPESEEPSSEYFGEWKYNVNIADNPQVELLIEQIIDEDGKEFGVRATVSKQNLLDDPVR